MPDPATLQRRQFFEVAGLSLAGLISQGLFAADQRSGDMIYRQLGRTNERVSAIGLGGYHIGVPRDEQESIRLVRSAIDRGINFMDNCWDYMDGKCEVWMGKALRDGYRQKVFLMTKFDGRTRAATARQIDESLQRLQTDHVDLMQYHENIRMEDPDRFFNDGVLDALLEARKAGKLRYIGFTGHKDPDIHLKMLNLAFQQGFTFDAVQMPLNVMDMHFKSFAHKVVPVLVEHGIGVVGMKPLADGHALESNTVTPIECLHYAMNLPTSVVINGCESLERLEQGLKAARTFRPLSQKDLDSLHARTAAAGRDGVFEPFKTTTAYDPTSSHPDWLG